MKQSKIFFIIILLFVNFIAISAQENTKDEFKPSGKIIARAFLDYSIGLNGDRNNGTGLDLTRAYLGYKYQITPAWSAQVIIDGAADKDAEGKFIPYVKNAFIRWEDKGFEISVGQIPLLQFETEERFWRYRYVMKSYQDLYKMGHSADFGITAKYKFCSMLTADLSITNGEGYKTIKKDNSQCYAAGVNFTPLKGMILQAYTDVYNDSEKSRESAPEGATDISYNNQYTFSLFAGYKNDKVSAGAEYSKIYNKGMIENQDYDGYSFYSTYKFAKKWHTYARYDIVKSEQPSNFSEPWNNMDGQTMIFGVEFQPMKNLKISPNIQNRNLARDKSEQYLFVNMDLTF